jgi:hypothetical protein
MKTLLIMLVMMLTVFFMGCGEEHADGEVCGEHATWHTYYTQCVARNSEHCFEDDEECLQEAADECYEARLDDNAFLCICDKNYIYDSYRSTDEHTVCTRGSND